MLVEPDALGRGQLGIRTGWQLKFAAIHEAGVVAGRIGEEFLKRCGECGLQAGADLFLVAWVAQVGASGNQQDRLIRALDGDASIGGGGFPADGGNA